CGRRDRRPPRRPPRALRGHPRALPAAGLRAGPRRPSRPRPRSPRRGAPPARAVTCLLCRTSAGAPVAPAEEGGDRRTETAPDPAGQEQTTIYTAYEIDFMLNLRPTEAGAVTREQIGLRSAPEEAKEFVTAAVTSGLRARGKVTHSEDGQWLLG